MLLPVDYEFFDAGLYLISLCIPIILYRHVLNRLLMMKVVHGMKTFLIRFGSIDLTELVLIADWLGENSFIVCNKQMKSSLL